MPTLIAFSHERWDGAVQRPRQLLSRLAREQRVLFIEEPVRGYGPAHLEVTAPAPGVQVLRAHTPLAETGFADEQFAVMRPLLAEYLGAEGIADWLGWFCTPWALPLIDGLPEPLALVYDCMDAHTLHPDAPRDLAQREAELLKRADLVLAGGPTLYAALRGRHDQLHCLPNAVDSAHYAPARLDRDGADALAAARLQAEIPGPRLGYFGVIDERLDLGLIAALADARPDWHIVMAGPLARIAADSLPRRANIHWLGLQADERLPHLVAAWHVCLLPFTLDAATRLACSGHALDYMAAEKPVVSTALPDVVALYGDMVAVADDESDFIAACGRMLAESGQARAERLNSMLRNVSCISWDAAARSVAHLLELRLREAQTGATRAAPRTTRRTRERAAAALVQAAAPLGLQALPG